MNTLKIQIEKVIRLFKQNIKKERFMFYREEGEMIPRFFLPVKWRLFDGQLECWVFWLAPFVWFGYTVKNAFFSVIGDSLEWGKLIEQKLKGFKNYD